MCSRRVLVILSFHLLIMFHYCVEWFNRCFHSTFFIETVWRRCLIASVEEVGIAQLWKTPAFFLDSDMLVAISIGRQSCSKPCSNKTFQLQLTQVDPRNGHQMVAYMNCLCLQFHRIMWKESTDIVHDCPGQMLDPDDLPGLAHFCEHMLFLGTKKVILLSDSTSQIHVCKPYQN